MRTSRIYLEEGNRARNRTIISSVNDAPPYIPRHPEAFVETTVRRNTAIFGRKHGHARKSLRSYGARGTGYYSARSRTDGRFPKISDERTTRIVYIVCCVRSSYTRDGVRTIFRDTPDSLKRSIQISVYGLRY